MKLKTGGELYADYLADSGEPVVDRVAAQALLETTGQGRTIAGRQACTVPPGIMGLTLLEIRMGGEPALLLEVYRDYKGSLSQSALVDIVEAAQTPQLNPGGPGTV
jgi:hypothetical protein